MSLIELEKKKIEKLFDQAYTLQQKNSYSEARQCYENILLIDPNNSRAEDKINIIKLMKQNEVVQKSLFGVIFGFLFALILAIFGIKK